MSAPRRLFYGLVVLALAQVIIYYPQMPAIAVSHFNTQGVPDSWSSRNAFFGIYLSIIVLITGIYILAPGWFTQRIGFGMKIPNRDYWFAPERLDQTRAFFRRQMIIMGVVHLLLAMFTVQLAILANLGQEARLHSSIGWALGLYLLSVIAWLIHFWRHFSKT